MSYTPLLECQEDRRGHSIQSIGPSQSPRPEKSDDDRDGSSCPLPPTASKPRSVIWVRLIGFAAGLLFVKVLAEIVYEYRWYFPAHFDSAFLMGRQGTFVGAYRVAFYIHILTGPTTAILGAFLMCSGTVFPSGKRGFRRIHRWAGRAQTVLVTCLLVPTSVVMALQAYTGMIATVGFVFHAFATGTCIVMAAWHASRRRFIHHRRWATRCFILLCAPLLLRVISGATVVMQVDSDWTYRLTVWLCWLVPLSLYEIFFDAKSRTRTAGALNGAGDMGEALATTPAKV